MRVPSRSVSLTVYAVFFIRFPINKAFASVAQSVEQRTENPRVTGSIPVGGTITATPSPHKRVEGGVLFYFEVCKARSLWLNADCKTSDMSSPA